MGRCINYTFPPVHSVRLGALCRQGLSAVHGSSPGPESQRSSIVRRRAGRLLAHARQALRRAEAVVGQCRQPGAVQAVRPQSGAGRRRFRRVPGRGVFDEEVRRDYQEGLGAGVHGVPMFFLRHGGATQPTPSICSSNTHEIWGWPETPLTPARMAARLPPRWRQTGRRAWPRTCAALRGFSSLARMAARCSSAPSRTASFSRPSTPCSAGKRRRFGFRLATRRQPCQQRRSELPSAARSRATEMNSQRQRLPSLRVHLSSSKLPSPYSHALTASGAFISPSVSRRPTAPRLAAAVLAGQEATGQRAVGDHADACLLA